MMKNISCGLEQFGKLWMEVARLGVTFADLRQMRLCSRSVGISLGEWGSMRVAMVVKPPFETVPKFVTAIKDKIIRIRTSLVWIKRRCG